MSNYNSKLILAKNILLDKTHKNVLNYSTNDMLALLRSQGHIIGEASNYSFIQNGKVSVGFTYNQCLTANYIAYQNPNYSNKWFFAFIDRVEYESNKSTIIYYTIDNWATWFDNLTFKPCYVVREHVNDDTIGANTTEEGLAVQDFVCEQTDSDIGLGSMFYIGVLSNYNPETKTKFSGVEIRNRGVFGSELFLFRFDSATYPDGGLNLLLLILETNNKGFVDNIQDIFIIPYSAVPASQLEAHTFTLEGVTPEQTCTFYTLPFSFDATSYTWDIDKTLSFSDYTPKNNKCFCYPFNYLYGTNNSGDSEIYKYEDFLNGAKATFKVDLAISIGCSGRLVPLNYKKVSEYLDGSIALGKFPTCQWSSDAYTNWLTQNAVNISTSFMRLGMSAGSLGLTAYNAHMGQVAEKNPTTALQSAGMSINPVANIAGQVAGLIGSFHQAQLLPNRVTGINTADVNYSSNDLTFKLEHMRIKTEYLREIDDYFTRFGYKVIRVKTPNITGRASFNYIEIGQGERFAYGEVPPESLTEINMIAQNGLTIWHNHANIGNYNLNNSIV